jgi:hypothetical protein
LRFLFSGNQPECHLVGGDIFKILNSASARLLVSDGDDMASVNPKYSTTCVEAAAFGSGRLEEHAD